MLTGTEVETSPALGQGDDRGILTPRVRESASCTLINATIPEYGHGNRFNHEPKRPRKILMQGTRDRSR